MTTVPALPTTAFIRRVLWFSTVFNVIGALAFAAPATFGLPMGLPTAVPPIYAAIVSAFILLFGGLYAWQALQPAVLPPLLWLSAIGKIVAFAIFVACGITGELPWRGVVLGSGDLVLAVVYVLWMRQAAAAGTPSPSAS